MNEFKNEIKHGFQPENSSYSKIITLEELGGMSDKLKEISERLKKTPETDQFAYSTDAEININSVDELKKLLKEENFKINMAINRRRASLFLVACYFCIDKEPIEFLLEQGSEINRTDVFGYNCIMSVILNDNMFLDTKLGVIQMLLDKGADVNWLNIQCETALTLSLERMEPDIANLLLDNGAVLYK